jgi:hypothetical protein
VKKIDVQRDAQRVPTTRTTILAYQPADQASFFAWCFGACSCHSYYRKERSTGSRGSFAHARAFRPKAGSDIPSDTSALAALNGPVRVERGSRQRTTAKLAAGLDVFLLVSLSCYLLICGRVYVYLANQVAARHPDKDRRHLEFRLFVNTAEPQNHELCKVLVNKLPFSCEPFRELNPEVPPRWLH